MDHGHTTLNGAHDGINGDKTPVLVVHDGDNGISAKINGNSLYNLPSPATDSPATPTSSTAAPDVKIDLDHFEQESDVRHEPLPIKGIDTVAARDNASTVPQVGTPIDPSTRQTSFMSRHKNLTFLFSQALFPFIPLTALPLHLPANSSMM